MANCGSIPRVIITEQPSSKPIKYRYKCEGRSAGTIPGEFSTGDCKTYPTVQITGYRGKARIVVSCVTKEPPYRPHPHSLVGRDGCSNGICIIDVQSTAKPVSFQKLGIQCVRRRDVIDALHEREAINVDPFNTGFDHRNTPGTLDMNSVRLCFQAFIEDAEGKCSKAIQPAVSNPVNDIKGAGNLVICRLSDCVSPASGGMKDIYLLCKKVSKDNIRVRFFEGDERNPQWEGFPDIRPTQVHEQTAIWFKAPPYVNPDIVQPVSVSIQLWRPSDGASSEPRRFDFIPNEAAEPGMLKRKRQKFGTDPRRHALLDLHNQLQATQYNIPPTPDNLKESNFFQYPAASYHITSQPSYNREKVKNAIRAKCNKGGETEVKICNNMDNVPMTVSQLELREEQTCYNMPIQNDFCGDFKNLLDVDFEQLDSLLVAHENNTHDEHYNLLNIPMNAMTISETSCNLSGLLNVENAQLQNTISLEQLDNLLAII